MKKGILMETNRRYSIMMRSDGVFERTKPVQGVSIGEEVRYQPLPEKRGFALLSGKTVGAPYRITAMACMLLLLVMPFYFVLQTDSTYAYVNIDINPSIELEIDEDLEVTSVNPLNEDGQVIADKLEGYKGDKLNLVIDYIVTESEKLGLLSNGKNMLVGVSYLSDQTDVSVLSTVDDYFMTNNQDWNIATFNVPKEIREQAHKNKQSMNKIMAAGYAESGKEIETQVAESGDVNEQEKAIINSFFNAGEPEITVTESEEVIEEQDTGSGQSAEEEKQPDEKAETVEETATNMHPSELKEKNGTIHSEGKNEKSNGNPHKNKTEKPGKNVERDNEPNGKAKGYYKNEDKHGHNRKDKQDKNPNPNSHEKNKHDKKPNKNADENAKNKGN
ncbi:hypothetical protein ACFO3D_13000 [Virgibacillus kekensis]|uniref:RsgI N-terminal anti-sigma domain-containing protein n=1 Tax=Virgibacillus kekensis TaxID=202261 RepID=A0ABV9DJW2_9BACI